jgi:hypothetical protein
MNDEEIEEEGVIIKEECIKKISWAQKTHSRDTNLENQFVQLTSLILPTQHCWNL